RLWDYDAALVTNLFGLKSRPEDITMGFEHSKLGYMYDDAGRKQKLLDIAGEIEKDCEVLLVESGMNLRYGSSVNMDAISLTRNLDAKLVVVMAGSEDAIMDDIAFLKKSVSLQGVSLLGVIINKVADIEDFKSTHMDSIRAMGIDVLGILPFREELTRFSMNYLADMLFAKVLAGDEELLKPVKNIFVGAMSATAALREPAFKKEGKLIITSGERDDIILAALETDTAGIVLTNNILPSPAIISKAAARKVPLLLAHSDTFHVTKQIDDAVPLLTKESTEKVRILGEMAANLKVDVSG
ncbi:MAG: DRTGG domain-containing protein, partial [Thermoplasmata archaeon]